MDIKQTIRKIFEKGNTGLGWFVLWRLTLALLPFNVISALVAAQAGPNPAAGVGAIFALPIGGNYYLVPIAVPLVLVLWNWIGKMAMRKKLGVNTGRFVGWALYWRFVLWQLAAIVPLGLLIALVAFASQGAGDDGQMIIIGIFGLGGIAFLIYWNLNVIGFVVKRVAAMVPSEAAASGEAVAAAESGAPIRDYRAIFDLSRYGMNWMIGGAYVVAGLIGVVVFPLLQALFSGEFNFGMAGILHSIFIGLVIGGAGLAFFLHRLRDPFAVVALFALLMVASRVLIETPLINVAGGSFEATSMFHPAAILSRLSFAALFCAGLLAGIRLGGPTFLGFSLGIGAGQIFNGLLLNPLVWMALENVPIEVFWHPEGLATEFLYVAIDAAVTGALLWWACDWHLGRRGLRLTQQGSIVPRAGASGQPPPTVPAPGEDRWAKYKRG